MNSIGFSAKEEALLNTLTLDVVKSSEIEGENLNYEQVRSSIAKRLGIHVGGLQKADRNVEAVVDIMIDATTRYLQPLTEERILGWQAALFPTGYSGLYKIEAGKYRTGEMQILSGAMGKEKLHYEAVPAEKVQEEMDRFLLWFNNGANEDLVLRAAIAHFWFIIIHPFDDGNGRIARAMSDMLLTRAENSPERFYSMSSQILTERKRYYEVLQKAQHRDGDITEWLVWFLNCLKNALLETQRTLQHVLQKARFWQQNETTVINERQRYMINKLFYGFDGKLKTSKWAKMAKCSTDTALRDIQDLVKKNILKVEEDGSRNTSYSLINNF